MSYILDALRKADAQRERSRLPGLNDRPLGTDGDDDRGGHSPLLWGVLGVGVVSIGLAAWQLARTPAPAVPVVAQATSPAPASLTPPAPPVAATTPVPAARIEPPPPPVAVAPAAAPAPAAQRAGPAARREASAPAPAASRAAARAGAAASSPAGAAAPAAAEPSAVAPAGAPRLAITGGVYSQNASQRMLIVNGQVFSEGSEPAAGVVLEQIRPNQAVLNWRGQRYLVAY